ncbi:hypothetical protein [Legionella waltersii]|uniref:Enhanced entry protein EnhB n=1 Tax=Legionella waltersii TaxID=66969 RepID=A0A0W1A582_9GAMM|nr:hypothetical protein [Legionella waltersii]KTD76524.1 hypothetical protein Lwal_2246 [Legionella waltersii]SNU93929.1 Uncharacterised protein [Legionella waltersii]
MRSLFSLCILLFSNALVAETIMPDGCQGLQVQGEAVTIVAKKSKLILIHNTSQHDIWITHPVSDPGASAGWTSKISTGNWSALVVDKPNFILNCIESTPGHEQQTPCEGAIVACKWKGVKIPTSNQGTFWAGEDMSLSGLKTALGGRGFVIPNK